MSISKNWSAKSISGAAGYELIVKGEANVGMLDVMPELRKRYPQGFNPAILLLDLYNAEDATPEKYYSVQYNEILENIDQYESVDIFHDNEIIAKIRIEKV